MMVVPVPVRPVNNTRPFLRGALILQAITPCTKIGSGHMRLVICLIICMICMPSGLWPLGFGHSHICDQILENGSSQITHLYFMLPQQQHYILSNIFHFSVLNSYLKFPRFCKISTENPTNNFNIDTYISFSIGTIRSHGAKLRYNVSSTNKECHFSLNRISHLWNSLPIIDLNLPINIKSNLTYGNISLQTLIQIIYINYIIFALVVSVFLIIPQAIIITCDI